MADPLPLYMEVDGYYQGKDMNAPYGDFISEGPLMDAVPTALGVTPTTPVGLAVQIAAGVCWVTRDAAGGGRPPLGDEGAYRCVSPTAQQVAFSPAAANPRIDRVVIEVLDKQYGAAVDLWRFRVVAGTPGSTPAAPAEPPTAITLALVNVPAGAAQINSGNITDSRRPASVGGAAGGMAGAMPVGMTAPWFGAVAPPRWVMCNGVLLPRAVYPELFAVLGTAFGGAATTFGVPDARDRMLIGAGGALALGAVGGVVAHSHTLPDHSHATVDHVHASGDHAHYGGSHIHRVTDTGGSMGIPDSASANFASAGSNNAAGRNHKHIVDIFSADQASAPASSGVIGGPPNTGTASALGTYGVNGGPGSAGAGGSLPPYLAANLMIRALP